MIRSGVFAKKGCIQIKGEEANRAGEIVSSGVEAGNKIRKTFNTRIVPHQKRIVKKEIPPNRICVEDSGYEEGKGDYPTVSHLSSKSFSTISLEG